MIGMTVLSDVLKRNVKAVLGIVLAAAVAFGCLSAGAGYAYAEVEQDDPFAFRGGAVLQNLREEAKNYPEYYDLRNADLDGDGVGDNKSFVTPVRLQNPFGTCWGFAAAAAAESSLIADGLADESIDLSEKHITWFTTSHIDDPESPQNGEGTYFKNLSKNDLKTSAYRYSTGGFTFYATTLFSSGIGPVEENAKDPETNESLEKYLAYRGLKGETIERRTAVAYDEEGNPTKWARKPVWYSDDDDWSMPEKYRYLQSFQLVESNMLPSLSKYNDNWEIVFNEDGLNAIKQQMYDSHKAVSIAFCAETFLPGQDTSGKEYMSKNWAHYVDKPEIANHVVTIVGWDDNYPKENFLEGHQPPGNGAFLIKNSWGSELNDFPNNGYRHWGLLEGLDKVPYDPDAKAVSDRATGYFWISYYDNSISSIESFTFKEVKEDEPVDIAQSDFIVSNNIGLCEDYANSKAANVFTAERTSRLEDISVITTVPGTEVKYEVYMLREDFDDPEDGLKIAEGNAGTFEYGGYHRISISCPKVLAKGQKYSVVILETADNDSIYRYGSPDGSYMTIKACQDAKNSPHPFYDVAIVNEGESFCLRDGKWKDISSAEVQNEIIGNDRYQLDNFPIKAYLKPVFGGYLSVSNWQEGTPGSFGLLVGESKTMSAEFRGLTGATPDDWDPEITWTSSDENIVKVIPDSKDFGQAVFQGVSEGKAYITVDAGEYGTRVIGINVNKPGIVYISFDDEDKVYTGKQIKPQINYIYMETVDGGMTQDVVEGVDYTVEYKNNVNAGEASITVTGIGQYGGTCTEKFNILKAPNKIKASGKTVKLKAYTLKKKKQVVKKIKAYKIQSVKGKLTYSKVSVSKKKFAKKFTVDKKTGNITAAKGLKKGTYKVTVKISDDGGKNYKASSKKVTVTIKVK